IDAGTRSIYPFIPQISAGLGLTVFGFSWLIFARSMVGITAPLFGVLGDKYGQRKVMALGLVSQSIGAAGMVFTPHWWAAIPITLFGLGTAAFVPTQQAYISNQVSYEKRGRAITSVEISFALTGVITLPIIGWMIDQYGWESPFLILGILGLIAALITWFYLPASSHEVAAQAEATPQLGPRDLIGRPNAIASMGVSLLLFFAFSNFITIWGVWLTEDFGFSASDNGLVATRIGLAELVGAALSGLFIDRIGKRLGSIIGFLLIIAGFIGLPIMQPWLGGALAAVILLGGAAEYTIVSLLPLYSDQVPEARATVFAFVGFGSSIGLAVGSPVAASLWERTGNIWVICAIGAVSTALALLLLIRYLHE
ncbi:MAG: MFS transporter, partial [Chloroflexota bacterium]